SRTAEDSEMASDERSMRPTGTGQTGGDTGGIPGTMKRGVADANDRRTARRDGLPQDEARSGAGAAMSDSRESGAHAPKPGIDRTDDDTGTPRPPGRSADGDASGQDDSVAESLGKAVSEPLRSS